MMMNPVELAADLPQVCSMFGNVTGTGTTGILLKGPARWLTRLPYVCFCTC